MQSKFSYDVQQVLAAQREVPNISRKACSQIGRLLLRIGCECVILRLLFSIPPLCPNIIFLETGRNGRHDNNRKGSFPLA